MAAEPKVLSLRERILSSTQVPEELIHVPDWGADVLVRGLTGGERARFQKAAIRQQGGQMQLDWEQFWSVLVILSAYDPDTREPIFEMTDRDVLLRLPAAGLEMVASVARRLSGLEESALPKSASAAE